MKTVQDPELVTTYGRNLFCHHVRQEKGLTTDTPSQIYTDASTQVYLQQ